MTANIRHSTENNEFVTPLWLVDIARHVLGGIDLDPASSHWVNQDVRASRIYTVVENGLLQPKWEGRTFLNGPGGLVDGSGRAVYRKTKLRHGCDRTGACGLLPATIERIHIGGVPHDRVTRRHLHQDVTSSQVVWWRALCKQWQLGNVTAAFFVGFSLELLQACQEGDAPGPHPLDFPHCVPKKRIKFDIMDGARLAGNQPTHSNVLVLLPPAFTGLPRTGDDMIDRFAEAMKDVGHVGGCERKRIPDFSDRLSGIMSKGKD